MARLVLFAAVMGLALIPRPVHAEEPRPESLATTPLQAPVKPSPVLQTPSQSPVPITTPQKGPLATSPSPKPSNLTVLDSTRRNAAMGTAVDSLLRKDASTQDPGAALGDDDARDDVDSGNGKQGLPFAIKKPTKKQIAAFQLVVLRSVTAMRKRDFTRARSLLAKAEPTERLAQVYKAILLAKAHEGMKDYVRADSVLQACLEWVGGSVWQNYLLDRRVRIFPQTAPSDSARLLFYSKAIQASVSRSVKVNFLYELLRLQSYAGPPAGHEELLKRLISLAPSDKRLDSLYRKLLPHAPMGQTTLDFQASLLQAEEKLGLWDEAMLRNQALSSLVPGQPEKQKLNFSYAGYYFKKKAYREAIALYTKYLERFGESPDAYLQIARSHDRLLEPKKALLWYDKFLEKFPKHEKASEIYWLRAWELEQAGQYEEAIEQYFRQQADFKNNKRGDWANFRIGLSHYKAGNFAASLQAFRSIRSQENSNAYSAGTYWESMALEALQDSASARTTLLETYRNYPFHFYGHQARQALITRKAWADSLEPWRRFSPSSPQGVQAWMKQGMSDFSARLGSDFESEYLGIGKLLQFRLDTLALLTMRTLPGKVKNNPWFLYTYARKFKERELWKEAYKLGLQLSYKIPPDRWGAVPREVLRLIYPRPYEAQVQKFSAKRGVDPAFVFALMRQESGFDRDIKSGAGAIGLMQIMPATGRALAKKDRLGGFEPQNLVLPETNIRLGTAYLRELKKQYQGNYYFVLANYNAGPEPTKRWLSESASKPIEMIVEDVSYWETRDYLKKVMGNYWTYRILWNNRAKGNG